MANGLWKGLVTLPLKMLPYEGICASLGLAGSGICSGEDEAREKAPLLSTRTSDEDSVPRSHMTIM